MLSCVQLCGSMDCSLPGASVHGILHARILEWVAILDQTWVSCLAGRFFTVWATREAPQIIYISTCVCLDAQLCLTLCNLMDCCSRGSSVHGILQARILEWVAIKPSNSNILGIYVREMKRKWSYMSPKYLETNLPRTFIQTSSTWLMTAFIWILEKRNIIYNEKQISVFLGLILGVWIDWESTWETFLGVASIP